MSVYLREIFSRVRCLNRIVTKHISCTIVGSNVMSVTQHIVTFDKHSIDRAEF